MVAGNGALGFGDGPLSLTVLGATGSVGTNTLDLVAAQPDAFDVVALTAQDNADALASQARQFRAKFAAIGNPDRYADLKEALSGTGIACAAGANAVVEAAEMPAACVMAAIVGTAGLPASLAAVRRGTRVALANKECLVTAGRLFMQQASSSGCELLPVDSEHSAVFQALAGQCRKSVEKVTLTASGGPFRTWPKARIAAARPEEALKHPNWTMGRKISIDSATMMNKGLELIEAHFLFELGVDELDVIVHPQSIIHSMVSFKDGSVIAQLGDPDMRTPIACALAWPTRMNAPTKRLDLATIANLTFEAPNTDSFPALRLAIDALRQGGTAPAVLNAANEVAVHAFLDRRIPFPAIAGTVNDTLEQASARGMPDITDSLDDVLVVDGAARELARELIDKQS
ncbi:MAG: 1-deoxy-D-xylulose-5-phosphate reductoisomerase [Pseudomonadota bacterium]